MNSISTANSTSATSDSGGVAPPDGYTTDTDSMSSSARTINNAAEDAEDEVDEVQPTELTGEEFGTEHTEHHADYAAGIQQLGEGATGMCTSLMSFAGQLGGAGQAYGDTEAGATNTVSQPGSGM